MDVALPPPHGPIWHGATVLVVDDQQQVRGLLRRMPEAEGFHVEEAPDGESALTLVQARAEPFDLVLTDLSMPHIDGRQVSECVTPSPAPPVWQSLPRQKIVRVHSGLSKLASAIKASRTTRVQTLDLVVTARELRRAAAQD